MTIKEDVKEIRNKLEKVEVDVVKIKTNLENHLAHHMQEKEWIKWTIPISLTVLNLILAFLQAKS